VPRRAGRGGWRFDCGNFAGPPQVNVALSQIEDGHSPARPNKQRSTIPVKEASIA
jgi:hypothetical protein